jgi:hypothetical protein
MAKSKKVHHKKDISEKINHGSMTNQKMYEDFNKEQPLPQDVTLKMPESEISKMYTCPVHHEILVAQPGKCPTCGMVLIEKK